MPVQITSDLDRTLLFRCADFEVIATRWQPGVHASHRDAHAPRAAIEIMRSGSFIRAWGRETSVGDPNTALLFNPGEEFRVSHGIAAANSGTTVRLLPPGLQSLLEERPTGLVGKPDWPFGGWKERVLAAHSKLLHMRLLRAVREGEQLAVREAALALVWSVLGATGRPTMSVASRNRAVLAQEFLAAHARSRIDLDQIASTVGCAAGTLCRDFKAHTGATLHRYLVRLRLAIVLQMIEQGEESLTRAALAAGFHSHSHMTAWFRREYGCPPSMARDASESG